MYGLVGKANGRARAIVFLFRGGIRKTTLDFDVFSNVIFLSLLTMCNTNNCASCSYGLAELLLCLDFFCDQRIIYIPLKINSCF